MDKLETPSEGELAMLEETAAELKSNSRLACQVKVSANLEGMTVHLPDVQS